MEALDKGSRKLKRGTVVSNKMQKTVVVSVPRTLRHPKYGKVITRTKKYYAHHDLDSIAVGTEVNIEETRPLSKLKRWRVVSESRSA